MAFFFTQLFFISSLRFRSGNIFQPIFSRHLKLQLHNFVHKFPRKRKKGNQFIVSYAHKLLNHFPNPDQLLINELLISDVTLRACANVKCKYVTLHGKTMTWILTIITLILYIDFSSIYR